MKHEPIITDRMSACTCKRWNGPARAQGETQGAFTVRAAESHRQHAAAAAQPVQRNMFDADLFEGSACNW